jgi:hypothetical protein
MDGSFPSLTWERGGKDTIEFPRKITFVEKKRGRPLGLPLVSGTIPARSILFFRLVRIDCQPNTHYHQNQTVQSAAREVGFAEVANLCEKFHCLVLSAIYKLFSLE